MIWSNILRGKKYGVVQTVSPISRDLLILAIELNCSDSFSSKTDNISKIAFVSQNLQSFERFTEGNARKSTVKLEKPMFSFERGQVTEARIISVHAVIKL